MPSYVILDFNTYAKEYMSEVYFDQLTFCKEKSPLCHPAYHPVATIGPGVIFVGQLGAPVEEVLPFGTTEGLGVAWARGF